VLGRALRPATALGGAADKVRSSSACTQHGNQQARCWCRVGGQRSAMNGMRLGVHVCLTMQQVEGCCCGGGSSASPSHGVARARPAHFQKLAPVRPARPSPCPVILAVTARAEKLLKSGGRAVLPEDSDAGRAETAGFAEVSADLTEA